MSLDLTTLTPLSADGPNPDPDHGEQDGKSSRKSASALSAVSEVNQFYERGRRFRQPYEIQWFVNASFARGQQTTKWNPVSNRLESQKTPAHRVKRPINLILPKLKARLAKFVKARPLPNVLSASTNREAVMDAKATEKVLQFKWRQLGLEVKYEDAILWAMITGKSFWWLHWDPNAIAQVKGKETFGKSNPSEDAALGDVMIELGTAFEVLVGDVGIARTQDQQQIMRVKVRIATDVEKRYELPAGTIKGETTADNLFQFERQIANIGARNITGYSSLDKPDGSVNTHTAVKELFTRPNADYPNGRYTVVAGEQLLKDEDELPYNFGEDMANPFPCVEFCDMMLPGQFWPTTMVEQLVGIQSEYNECRNRAEEQLKVQSHPKLLVPVQANLAPNAYNSEAGEKIMFHFIPGMPPPTFLAPPSIAVDTWKAMDAIRLEFDEISNIRPADVGQSLGAGESGFQTNLLQEASDSVHAPDIRRNELAIEEISFKMRRLMAMGYTTPRLISIVGKNSAPDVFEFSQDNIDEHAQIIVQAGSALPTLKAARAKMIMEMHQAALFGDPNDPATKRQVLGMLEVNGTEEAVDMTRRDEDMATLENLEVSQGKAIPAPMPWENHQIQYTFHTDQLKSNETQDWKQPMRDELVRHTILHARFINPQNALQMAQQFGYDDLVKLIQPMIQPPAPPPPPPNVQADQIKGQFQLQMKEMEIEANKQLQIMKDAATIEVAKITAMSKGAMQLQTAQDEQIALAQQAQIDQQAQQSQQQHEMNQGAQEGQQQQQQNQHDAQQAQMAQQHEAQQSQQELQLKAAQQQEMQQHETQMGQMGHQQELQSQQIGQQHETQQTQMGQQHEAQQTQVGQQHEAQMGQLGHQQALQEQQVGHQHEAKQAKVANEAKQKQQTSAQHAQAKLAVQPKEDQE